MTTTRVIRRRSPRPTEPRLRFTPLAWAQLLYLRDRGPTEIGGFGLASADDLLRIEAVRLVRQTADFAAVRFDDEAVADFFDEQVDRGLPPARFARVWIHTHPGDSPAPSSSDEVTFARVFGPCDWAVMFILAAGCQTYARLRFAAGPGGELQIPVGLDWQPPFAGSDHDAWEAEYQACVRSEAAAWITHGDLVTHGDPDFFLDDLDPVPTLFEEFHA